MWCIRRSLAYQNMNMAPTDSKGKLPPDGALLRKSLPIFGDLAIRSIGKENGVPVLAATVGGRDVRIRFENGGLGMLGGVFEAGTKLRTRHAAVRDAAEALLQAGYWIEAGGALEICVTALDL